MRGAAADNPDSLRLAGQIPLFGHEAPEFDASFSTLERIELADGAWIEVARGWLSGHDRMFGLLLHGTRWQADERVMYERQVEVPRLHGVPAARGPAADTLRAVRAALDARYATEFERVTLGLYRDGRDSVAFHGDYVARRMQEALVATVSVGAPRRFLLRPTGGGPALGLSLGWGDLLVMGGSCQRTYQHAVPKVARADPRISIMFRPVWPDDGGDTAPRADR
ncbi:alpha-ketoglutarate-dependent dioxygenase AlkB [Nannocystis sp. SCPEA4]|uniref:alpha-ketoglutarate-dependent dioxygenase AlkB n=1 Tax=Nannocystis sp. SCPEA4 TaxID=2996787 RepID=UPI002270D214|nr:alpha-ketoglutarate-dependent dioxygenase AlkB [Nannocystis sp. SCPEA4]MCY1060840.1 alpha-ketoglutarate-dependent dioxygenase AlkB [Nannocystis sp. SCPEA4]